MFPSITRPSTNQQQGVVNWVAQPAPGQDPPQFEARLYDVLFSSEEPAELDDWLADLNPASKEVLGNALANPVLAKAAVGSRCDQSQATWHSTACIRACTHGILSC